MKKKTERLKRKPNVIFIQQMVVFKLCMALFYKALQNISRIPKYKVTKPDQEFTALQNPTEKAFREKDFGLLEQSMWTIQIECSLFK